MGVDVFLVFSAMAGGSQTDMLRQSGKWGWPVSSLQFKHSLEKSVKVAGTHCFTREEIISKLKFVFVSLYFKVSQKYEMVERCRGLNPGPFTSKEK